MRLKLYLGLAILFIGLLGVSKGVLSSPPRPLPSPQIVASEVLLAQVGQTPLTTIYTPVAPDEVLHVSGYVVYTDFSYGANNTYISLQWTDELEARTNPTFCTVINGACQGEIVIHSVMGVPIQFSSNNPGVTTPYNLYITVTKE